MTQLSDDCFAFGGELMRLDEALRILQARVRPAASLESVALAECRGRILAEDVVSERNVPPHDNSAVDGYAVRFSDLERVGPTTLPVRGRASAGHPLPGTAMERAAVRIFTGAAMPAGLDTVVMQEDVALEGDAVVIPGGLKKGANRRLAGEDIAEGAKILTQGRRLRPSDIGLAASVGRAELRVRSRLRVALFSTGDEVCEPGDALPLGGIYDSNRFTARALIEALGARISDLGILPDRADVIAGALDEAAKTHDLILTTGGVSMGEEDHVRTAVEALGRLHFWRLAVKPGRPVALGQIGAAAFAGLPGNPVATVVMFLMVVRPLALRLAGAVTEETRYFPVRAGFAHAKKAGRREWIRARLERTQDGMLAARKFRSQGSGLLTSISDSDGLVELPEELTEVHEGDFVSFAPFSGLDA